MSVYRGKLQPNVTALFMKLQHKQGSLEAVRCSESWCDVSIIGSTLAADGDRRILSQERPLFVRYLLILLLGTICAVTSPAQSRKLLVISIDGLDHRYLKDRDALKLRIPNLRKLIAEGALADGVVGVVPTNTWPSHTTLVTGVRSDEHGILDNNIRTEKGVERYWYMTYLKAPTLWHAVRKAGKTSAAITWPVTVGDGIDYNLPEYFQGRAGGAMDLKSIQEKATPGLVDAIAKDYPSFATQWMDDRTRALGTMHILRRYQPDLTLLHFVDHDSTAHEMGPFSREAIATLEYTDELIGGILGILPANTVVAVVSDHGFETVKNEMSVPEFLAARKLSPEGVEVRGGFLSSTNLAASDAFARAGGCVGREVPRAEVERFLPNAPAGLRIFEPASGCYFARGKEGASLGESGRHGHWPTRYRASFLLWGPGIEKKQMPEMDMRDAAARFAQILGVTWPVRK